MPMPIVISVDQTEFEAQLDDGATARELAAHLPPDLRMSRWGNEYHGTTAHA